MAFATITRNSSNFDYLAYLAARMPAVGLAGPGGSIWPQLSLALFNLAYARALGLA